MPLCSVAGKGFGAAIKYKDPNMGLVNICKWVIWEKQVTLETIKIAELPSATQVVGDDYLVVEQPDKTKKVTVSQVISDLDLANKSSLTGPGGAAIIGTEDGQGVQKSLDTDRANTRELWRRALHDLGLTLVDGSFEEGAVLSYTTDAIWHMDGAQCYTWAGTFPKTVPADSTPSTTGGVSTSAWVTVGGLSLLDEMTVLKNEAEDARDEAQSYALQASELGNLYASTSEGIAATTDGQYFQVPQGAGASVAYKVYKNTAGTAVEVATVPGIGAILNTTREYPTLSAAQAEVSAGNISAGAKVRITSSLNSLVSEEYVNNSGTLVSTGKKTPSKSSVLLGSVDNWTNNNLYPFSSFSSTNENSISLVAPQVSTTTYREAYATLVSGVATGDIITVRYKFTGTGAAPTVGLKTSLNGTFVSNQPVLVASDIWQEVKLTATASTATLLTVSVNTTLATNLQISIIAYGSNKNSITSSILSAMDGQGMLTNKIKIGSVNTWVNNQGYPFSSFSQDNDNRVTYGNPGGTYSEMYGNIDVPSGQSVSLNYSLTTTSGRLFARLANGSTWTSDEVQLASGGVRQEVKLTATAATKQLKIYSKAEVSSGSIFTEVNYGQRNALTEQIDSLYTAIASANAILAILSQASTFDSFVKSSPYTYTLSDSGTSYKQLLNSVATVSGASSIKMMYKITSSTAALKIQSRNGNAWGANEKPLTADGKYHEIDLPIAAGQVFSGWGVYSQPKAGGYSADVTMIPISADGVFFTPATAILYGLMMSSSSLDSRVSALESGSGQQPQDTTVIFPSYFYAVDGRPLRFYGSNMVSGNRPWRNGADIVLSSHGYDGKPILLKDVVPDAMIMPSEINGSTLNVNARADNSGNIYRKKAAFSKLASSQTGSVKVATIMDSLGERCVPWLYFAINSTGATYVGAGSRTTRGMTDDGGYVLPNTPSAGIPFDGRGGWTTFDYIGKTQKTNFSQPFLRDATSTDFAAYPQYCFDKAYSGQSYADNPNLSAYHIFDVTAWMAAAGVSASDKLVVVIQLGYNDLYYNYTPQQTADAQEFMIAKFREKIADSRFVISHQAFGWSGVSAPQNWPDFAKWITQKLRKFDNRLGEKIIVAPAWAQLSYKYGMNETITATSDTGVQTVALSDDVHPGELGGAQWGDAMLGPVLAAWAL
nr:MAG: Tail spike receptor binding N-terminal domain [Bacteriophage sp.]